MAEESGIWTGDQGGALGPFSANEERMLAQASMQKVQQACPSIWLGADPIDNINRPWEYREASVPCSAPFLSVLCDGSRAPYCEKQEA